MYLHFNFDPFTRNFYCVFCFKTCAEDGSSSSAMI